MIEALKNKFNSSLKYKIVLVFLLTAFIPLLILEFVNTYSSHVYSKKTVLNDSRTFIQQISTNVQDRIHSLEMSSMMVIIDNHLRNMLRGDAAGDDAVTSIEKALEANQFLANIEIQNENVWAVTLMTSTDIYCRFRDQTVYNVLFRSKYKQMEWYQSSLKKKGEAHIIGVHYPYQAVSSNQNVISLARSIFDGKTGKYWGTILVDVKVDLFHSICDSDSSGSGNFIKILDENNQLVCESSNAVHQDTESFPGLFEKNNGSKFIKLTDGKTYAVVYTVVPEINWKIVRYISSQYMFQHSNVSIRLGIVLSLLTLIFIVTGTVWLIRSILIPIKQLNSETRKIGAGDFSHSIVSDNGCNDEIGQLVTSVTLMKQDLNELITRLSTVQSRQKEAELNALQKQIKPHFIYNTLNSIQMLAVMEGANGVALMIRDFSMLFRSSIEKGDLIVPLREEVDYIQRYMNIQKLRYGDKIAYYDDIDPEILDYCTIRFTLQPTVENAVSHGLENKIENGYVRLRSEESETSIKIIVEDDGVGINESMLEVIRTRMKQDDDLKSHIGMANVHKRLQKYFGEQYGIEIRSQVGIGTVVELNIPKISANSNNMPSSV